MLDNLWAHRFAASNRMREELGSFVEFYIRNANNRHWYRIDGMPRTNNSLEASNNQVKKRVTMHNRLPVREFIEACPADLKVWSMAQEYQV